MEDLQWLDGESLDFPDGLVDSLPAARVLLLVTYRTGHEHPWTHRSVHVPVRLEPLDDASMEELLRDLAGDSPALRAVARSILDRAQGNPLFLEEIVRQLVETGAVTGQRGLLQPTRQLSAGDIPPSLHALLAARVDRLAPDARAVLNAAAVIGDDIDLDLLKAVTAAPESRFLAGLSALLAAEFLYETRLFPDTGFTFRHALMRQVVYGSLLAAERRLLHRRAAEAIEARTPEPTGERLVVLARHLALAELWDRACDRFLAAAETAKRRYSYQRAVDLAEEALAAARRAESRAPRERDVLTLLGDLASLLGDLPRANRHYDEALALEDDPALRRRIANRRHEPHLLSRAGARIAWYSHGSGAPAIMLVTGLVYGLAMLQPLIERLCQEFRVLTLDLRGSGASDPVPEGGYRVADHAADVVAVIEASGCAPVVGVGTSRGGNVLARVAVERPDLLRQLVLVGSPLDDTGTAARPDHDPDLAPRIQAAVAAGEFETALRLFVPTILEPGFEDWGEQLIQNCLRMPPGSLQSFFSPDPSLDLAPLLPRLRLPVLVMHGDADRRVPLDVARRLVARLPDARLYVFRGRGHVATYTAPGEFCDALRDFVRAGGRPDAGGEATGHA